MKFKEFDAPKHGDIKQYTKFAFFPTKCMNYNGKVQYTWLEKYITIYKYLDVGSIYPYWSHEGNFII